MNDEDEAQLMKQALEMSLEGTSSPTQEDICDDGDDALLAQAIAMSLENETTQGDRMPVIEPMVEGRIPLSSIHTYQVIYIPNDASGACASHEMIPTFAEVPTGVGGTAVGDHDAVLVYRQNHNTWTFSSMLRLPGLPEAEQIFKSNVVGSRVLLENYLDDLEDRLFQAMLSYVEVQLPMHERIYNLFIYLLDNMAADMKSLNDAERVERMICLGEAAIWSHVYPDSVAIFAPRQSTMETLRKLSPAQLLAILPVVRHLRLLLSARFRTLLSAFVHVDSDAEEQRKYNTLELAISIGRKCIEANADDICTDHAALSELLRMKAERPGPTFGDLDTLHEAVKHARASFEGESSASKSRRLYGLGNVYQTRFSIYEMEDDLDECIAMLRAAFNVAVVVGSGCDEEYIMDLQTRISHALQLKIRTSDNLEGVADECLQYLRQLTQDPGICANQRNHQQCSLDLASMIGFQIERRVCDAVYLDEAISILMSLLYEKDLVEELRPMIQVNLSLCLVVQAEMSNAPEDMDTSLQFALSIWSEVLETERMVEIFSLTAQLIRIHTARYCHSHGEDDLVMMMRYCNVLNETGVGSKQDRFKINVACARVNHSTGHLQTALSLYEKALSDLPQLVMLGREYKKGKQSLGSNLQADAAAACISAGQYQRALEILELGRSLAWTRGLQMRSKLDDLAAKHPSYAYKFRELSRELEGASVPKSNTTHFAFGVKEPAWEEQFVLSERWNTLLCEIRNLDGFQDFLSTPKFDQLQHVANRGAVVLTNLSKYRCDAFILTRTAAGDLRLDLVSLSDDLYEDAKQWSSELLEGIQMTTDGRVPEAEFSRRTFKPLLRKLWQDVTYPIREKLDAISPDVRRIWWCPTSWLTFLPLHLVTNGVDNHKTSAELVPSYIPTLSSLLRTRTRASRPQKASSLLAVSCKEVAGYDKLPGSSREIEALKRIVADQSVNLTVMSDSSATTHEVLTGMSTHTWLHLACHGIQSSDEPYKSHFVLNDGPLYLSDIVNTNLEDAQFAFLSACQTATGIPELSDEAMHLAGGLQFAGYRATIATMWSVHDKIAKRLSDEVYSYLFRDSERVPTAEDTAEALHRATQVLKDKNVPLFRLAPFIHIGV